MSLEAPTDAADLPAWLCAARARYGAEPCEAGQLLEQVQRAGEWLRAQPADERGIELALLAFDLALEQREIGVVAGLAAWAMEAGDNGIAPRLRARVLCMQARVCIFEQQVDRALQLLARAVELAHTDGDALALATVQMSLAVLTVRQRDMAQAAVHARESIAAHAALGATGPWAQAYSILAVALRELGDQPGREAALREGISVNEAERRWPEAINLMSGLVDMALERGDVAAGEAWIARAQQLRNVCGRSAAAIAEWAVAATRVRCLAARERWRDACDGLQPLLAVHEHRMAPTEVARWLEQLADWSARAGDGAAALAYARRAHAVLMALTKTTMQRDMLALRQRLELDHAERARARDGREAAELQLQNEALELALQQQRELQAELIESSKMASLGHLLAGVAHELNTPLGTALTALSSSVAAGLDARASIEAGTASRTRLRTGVDLCTQGHELARENLQRALELAGGFRHLPDGLDAVQIEASVLAPLVEMAWRRAIGTEGLLHLVADVNLEVPVAAEALTEVLVQLFQNVARHAYEPGRAGEVEVVARLDGDRIRLTVADRGRGIAAELLPRVFEPYVSTQFGRGRSGLGLFVAQATVARRLGGRMRAFSAAGQGTRIEIEWPAAAPAA